jgi:hypothetical protein
MGERHEKSRAAEGPVSSSTPVVSIDPSAANARFQLQVAMAWPREKERRNEALASYAALGLDKAHLEAAAALEIERMGNPEGLSVSEVAASLRKSIEDEIIIPAGGYPAVARAIGIEQINSRIETVTRTIVSQVGGILHFAVQLDRIPDIGV